MCLPILCRGGRTLGEDFFLAFAPEREDPGREEPMRSVPRLVGGLDEASQGRAVALYEQVCDAVVSVSSAEVAEAAKLLRISTVTEDLTAKKQAFKGTSEAFNALDATNDALRVDLNSRDERDAVRHKLVSIKTKTEQQTAYFSFWLGDYLE